MDDEEAHDDRRQGVEHPPVFAQQDSSADSRRGTNGRERVAPVVPGVGDDRRAVVFPSYPPRVLEQHFFRHYRDQRRHQRNPARLVQRLAPEERVNPLASAPQDTDAHHEQRHPDKQRGKVSYFPCP